jgi:hypothetical protein
MNKYLLKDTTMKLKSDLPEGSTYVFNNEREVKLFLSNITLTDSNYELFHFTFNTEHDSVFISSESYLNEHLCDVTYLTKDVKHYLVNIHAPNPFMPDPINDDSCYVQKSLDISPDNIILDPEFWNNYPIRLFIWISHDFDRISSNNIELVLKLEDRNVNDLISDLQIYGPKQILNGRRTYKYEKIHDFLRKKFK